MALTFDLATPHAVCSSYQVPADLEQNMVLGVLCVAFRHPSVTMLMCVVLVDIDNRTL